ncbi:hypothetical protein DFQ28_009538 [Apophysomyces sp. BC1034]|nr:hypothetical protein DFQ29_007616 [Apophysomyces sp. BC1021]KAG0192312.1 hypothetical protein DFQ28_009538 [Apophysomyces sp. BC1034]
MDEGGNGFGNAEVRLPGMLTALLSEDRARIADVCKHQLHNRMSDARSTEGFITLNMMVDVQAWS